MAAMTVADYLLQRLRDWGVEKVFGFPGDGINGLLAAWDRAENSPKFVQARHEEMSAFEAVGYAKFTGRLGVCAATSGPGAIHLLNGLYDAKLDHVPVLSRRAGARLFLRCGRLGGGAEFPGGALARFLGRLQLRLHGLELAVTPVKVVSGGADCLAVFLQAGSQLLFRLRCLVKSTLGAVQGFPGRRRRRLFRPRAARAGARPGLIAAGR